MKKFDLLVEDPKKSATDFGYNIFDVIISLSYFGASLFLLWNENIDLWVCFLNVLCISQAWIRTTIKSRELTTKFLEKLPKDDGNIDFVNHTCKGYARKITLEFVVIMCDLVLLLVIQLDAEASVCIMRIAISTTMFATFVDSFLSNLENMYHAHPAFPSC